MMTLTLGGKNVEIVKFLPRRCLMGILSVCTLKHIRQIVGKLASWEINICDAIKQNESELANTVFKIQANKAESFFCFLLFL